MRRCILKEPPSLFRRFGLGVRFEIAFFREIYDGNPGIYVAFLQRRLA